MSAPPFEIVSELAVLGRPDLSGVREQVQTLASVSAAFLAPDCHLGRPAVSSLAVAHEVLRLGSRAIACLNSRDRNLIGLRRDLLTASALGLDQVLLVTGDHPSVGTRADGLTVRSMLDEVRGDTPSGAPALATLSAGVTSGLRPLPDWKREADFVFTQVTFSIEELFTWRDALDLDVPVYAGVLVLAGVRTGSRIPGLALPPALQARLATDPNAGVTAACEQIEQIRAHGGFRGVHLVALGKAGEIAARLASAPSADEAPQAHRARDHPFVRSRRYAGRALHVLCHPVVDALGGARG